SQPHVAVLISLRCNLAAQTLRPGEGASPMAKPKPPKFADVSSEYWKLFLECRVNSDKLAEVQRIATSITVNRARYQAVTAGLGSMPWWIVALIHSLEGGLSFTTHLHHGDPLTARTKHVPAGRPVANPRASPKQA